MYAHGVKPAVSWSEALLTRTQPGERVRMCVMTLCVSLGSILLLSANWITHAAFWVPIGAILLAAGIVQDIAIVRSRRHGGTGNMQCDQSD
jgi:hypothetical protein